MNKVGPLELLIVLCIIILLIYFLKRKPNSVKNNNILAKNAAFSDKIEQTVSENISIPEICPHCKNPNTKRIRLCEWCGEQIA
jgi:hypothetical protein